MVTLSSHVLDSVIGDHAKGCRVVCVAHAGGEQALLFDVTTNDSGRISETIDVARYGNDIELQFHAADYFSAGGSANRQRNPMTMVTARLNLHDPDAQYHIPLVLSPHSYTFWWSGLTA